MDSILIVDWEEFIWSICIYIPKNIENDPILKMVLHIVVIKKM